MHACRVEVGGTPQRTFVRCKVACVAAANVCVNLDSPVLSIQEPLFLTQNVNDEVGRLFGMKDDGLVVRSMKKGAATDSSTVIVSVGSDNTTWGRRLVKARVNQSMVSRGALSGTMSRIMRRSVFNESSRHRHFVVFAFSSKNLTVLLLSISNVQLLTLNLCKTRQKRSG